MSAVEFDQVQVGDELTFTEWLPWFRHPRHAGSVRYVTATVQWVTPKAVSLTGHHRITRQGWQRAAPQRREPVTA